MESLRGAVRQLIKSPGFAVVAIATLAAGIGVISALFTVVSSVLFRPPGYRDPGSTVAVYLTSPGFRHATTSYPDYLDLRDQNTGFDGVALYQLQALGLARGDVSRSTWTEVVSGNYFSVLGVPAARGRTLDQGRDDVVGAAPVVVLSHPFWLRAFGGDPRVVGTSVRLNGVPFEIIGVTAPEFRGMVPGLVAEIWIPAAASTRVFPQTTFLTERANHNSFIMARLKPGVTVAQAASNAAAISRRLAESYPASNAGREFVVVPSTQVTLNPEVDGAVTGASVGLLAVPGLVLLIACANLATLFLTRATRRRREFAVRLALGAGRAALIRQLLAESLTLAVIGGGLGLLLSAWLARLLVRFQPPIPVPLSLDLQLDWRVVGFTALVAISSGVLFGLAPALRASRPDLVRDLREGSRGSASKSTLRSGLVSLQLALSVLLLVGSGLLVRSLAGAARVDLGFVPQGAATLAFDPSQQGYDPDRSRQLVDQLLGKVRAFPGVEMVSYTTRPPLNLDVMSNEVVAEGNDPGPGRYPEIQRTGAGPGYLATIGAQLAAGREFTDQDRADQPRVVMVNESAARLLWPGGNALGKRLATHGSTVGAWREVIGIVKDVKVMTIGEKPTPQIFFPAAAGFDSYLTLIARTKGDPARLGRLLREALRELDPVMPVIATGVLEDQVGTALFPVRFAALLLVVLGSAGLAIAAIGLYGIIAQGVAERTRELGIRIALGAEPDAVRRMVLRQGIAVAAVGLGIGLVVAALASRLLGSWLYGVSAHDPVAFLVAPGVLLLVAAAASFLPARRATRVDPVEALRAE